MANDPVTQMAADPDFANMAVAEQRKALTAHDPSFGQMADADITKFVSAHQTKNTPFNALSQATALKPAPKMFSKDWFKQQLVNTEDAATNFLPAAGGTIGGIAGFGTGGPLGGVGGAGIGGMGGEAAKQMLRRWMGFGDAPQTSEEAAKRITFAGPQQAAMEVPNATMPWLAGPLQKAATSQYERALAPTTKINKGITQDIAPEMIRRGESGSLEGLQKRAGEKIGQLSPQLNAAYQGAGKTIPGSGNQIVQDLENLKQTYMPGGNIAQPQAVNAIQGVQDIVKQYGANIDPNHLRRLRQIFEEVPAERGAYAGVDLPTNYTLKAQQQAADSIRGILNKTPDIGVLNKEISFWLDVQRVTSQSGLRRTGQEGGLMKVLAPLGTIASGAAGFAHGGAQMGLETGGAAALSALAIQITRSPAWRTASAIQKSRLADALARGSIGEVTSLAARFAIAAQGKMNQGAQTIPPQNQPTTQ